MAPPEGPKPVAQGCARRQIPNGVEASRCQLTTPPDRRSPPEIRHALAWYRPLRNGQCLLRRAGPQRRPAGVSAALAAARAVARVILCEDAPASALGGSSLASSPRIRSVMACTRLTLFSAASRTEQVWIASRLMASKASNRARPLSRHAGFACRTSHKALIVLADSAPGLLFAVSVTH